MFENEYYNSKEFENTYHYDGKLGSFCGPRGTDFYLWAPTADRIVLHLYQKGNGEERPECIQMVPEERGVWHYHTDENLDGQYYTYLVMTQDTLVETGDPYAKACGVNGERSMVIDLERTNPKGWEADKAPAYTSENIIYEIHVKDFTWDVSSGIDDSKRGKYQGLWQEGTTLNQDGIHPTGMDYLKQLGITHVQLMPIYDYGSVDEAGSDDQFNWGYDPVNYNVPEGSYSSDPYHGEVRIRELKEAILALHRNGFRVIMDVVYNHTYDLNSHLNRTVPGYYYRFREDGTPSNGSGCGNDTASERSMCGKYILDSVLYWAEEYHIDGFRFDLMGLLPVELMNRIREALDRRFGKNEKMLFGEPWRAGETCARVGTVLADKDHLKFLHPGVGAFCDTTRDMVKGNLMQEDARGIVNGGSCEQEIFCGSVKGWANMEGEYSVNAPSQTIGYLSCHDDWTLWDRLINTIDSNRSYEKCSAKVLRANRMAASILIGCQGNLFLLSGEEAARTKMGEKNSFASSIEINRIDWNRVWKNEKLMNYYKGLFALRKQMSFLCDKSEKASDFIRRIEKPVKECIEVEMSAEGATETWKRALFLYNLSEEAQKITLPEGKWQCLSDGTSSYLWQQSVYTEGVLTVDPMTTAILGR